MVTAVLAAAAVAFVLSGCGGEQLRALKADPMARFEPAGGELVDTDERDQGRGPLGTGTLYPAHYSRLFELTHEHPMRQLEAAIDAAAAAGWGVDVRPLHRSPSGAIVQSGGKRLASGNARLALTLFQAGSSLSGVDGPAILIRLTHDLS